MKTKLQERQKLLNFPDHTLEPTDTLRRARLELLEKLNKGSTCPCCGQLARRYRRKFTSTMARVLIELYAKNVEKPDTFWHKKSLKYHDGAGDLGKMKHWGLTEPEPGKNEDSGSPHRGFWRITAKGNRFVRGGIRIPRHVLIYDGHREGFSSDSTHIREAVGDAFDYDELMRTTRED